MKVIELTNGQTSFVSDQDAPLVSKFKWRYALINGLPYVQQATTPYPLLHRFLLNAKKGQIIDHINGNGLDNRRDNLRFCTHTQNMWNRKVHKNSSSGYRGVHKNRNAWCARIAVNKIRIRLGSFERAVDAAKAYDKVAKLHYGVFARLNFPEVVS